jgi:hypothetical protein
MSVSWLEFLWRLCSLVSFSNRQGIFSSILSAALHLAGFSDATVEKLHRNGSQLKMQTHMDGVTNCTWSNFVSFFHSTRFFYHHRKTFFFFFKRVFLSLSLALLSVM